MTLSYLILIPLLFNVLKGFLSYKVGLEKKIITNFKVYLEVGESRLVAL